MTKRSAVVIGGGAEIGLDIKTGKPADPVLVDRKTGRQVIDQAFRIAPGPAASEGVRRKHAASPWGGAAMDDQRAPAAGARRQRRSKSRA